MFSRAINKIFKRSYCERILTCRVYSSNTSQLNTGEEPDPAPIFFNQETQETLQLLTRIDYKKVVRKRLTGKRLQCPEYKFMTDKELEEALELGKKRAHKRLQMPPVVKTRKEIDVILSKDEALEGFDTSKYVFTDISFGIRDREKFIVIRELDGTLRYAKWEERERLYQVYNPRRGKEIVPPKLFHGEYLEDLLKREVYEYILDRACIQYDPDDPEYKRITETVYEDINKKKKFEYLRSTRHFGPLAFYLAWNKSIDKLLCDIIELGKMEEAVALIRLYHKIHPQVNSATTKCESEDPIKLILHYASLDSPIGPLIKKILAAYQELENERQKVAEGIKTSHGINSDKS
ncbi:28S ribosomal protein S22, mitochondrial [Vespa velutina]|uniref:28S ribosomal protein S22, mitochondrial n=1 Tax=Vespa velutina TaxID=202808 RepID=UPI001FB1DB11|nr:28S ribosomal protein S22, mitochondrial [Vespa velutina]